MSETQATTSEAETRPEAAVEVTPFEANLLRLVRGFVGATPRDRTLTIVFREFKRPKCLRATAVELVEESLRKGIVRRLAGWGWPRERFLRGAGLDARPVEGAVWDRTAEAERRLHFSHHTLEWLQWITAENPATTSVKPAVHPTALTLGDRLVQFMAMGVLHRSVAAEPVAKQPTFRRNPLVWLGWPDVMASGEMALPDFEPWTKPDRAWLLEVLQSRIAELWGDLETTKQELGDPGRLRTIGECQRAVLEGYLDTLEAAGRWDLARFVAEAVQGLFAGTARALPWFARLNTDELRMADRTEVYAAGLALPMAFRRLEGWQRRARGVGYLDDDYQLAQVWKSDWERWGGDQLADDVANLLRRFQLLVVE